MVRILALLFVLLWPLSTLAQEQAALVADRLAITGRDVLVAEGNVEVLYKGRRLTAKRIVYDRAADRLVIDGLSCFRTRRAPSFWPIRPTCRPIWPMAS